MSFICGFSGNQEDDLCILQSTSQRKTRRRRSFGGRGSKNPYSNRGLDKFEALLADLDGKRQMIYTKKGSEDISLVRFTYSSSNDVKPIVVKVKNHRKKEKVENIKTPVLSSPVDAVAQVAKPLVGCNKSLGFDQLRRKFGEWWWPSNSLPFFVILILVFLVFFGRSFAVFCTSIGWYMVPAVNGTSQIAKKEYSRKLSDKMILRSGRINTQPHRRSF